MATPLHDLLPSPGWLASDRTPDADQLYVSVEELAATYCYTAEDAEIRFAMALINAYTNRPSLWPEIYEERIDLADDRSSCILAARPVLKVLAAAGRYGGGRRDHRMLGAGAGAYYGALAMLGSAPAWQALEVSQIELYAATGEVWLPMGFFPMQVTQVQIRYQTGLPTIPARIKAAMAEIINTVRTRGVSDRTFYGAGKAQQTFTGTGFLSETSRMLLESYVVRTLG